MDCLFCKIVDGEVPCEKVYENDDFYAFLDIAPVNKGHTIIIPKKHCRNLLDFPKDIETDFMETAKKVAKAVMKGTGAGGFNLTMNNEPVAGQIIFHAHIHIIPRFEGDNHVHWDKIEYDNGEMEEYADSIREYL